MRLVGASEVTDLLGTAYRSSKLVRAGVLLLAATIVLSIVAPLLVPRHFLEKWNNPEYWKNNPQLAPPEWVGLLGYPVFKTMSVSMKPDIKTLTRPLVIHGTPLYGLVEEFTTKFEVKDATPTNIMARIERVTAGNSSIGNPYVVVVVVLGRPDGKDVLLAHPLSGRLSNIPSTVTVDRRLLAEEMSSIVHMSPADLLGMGLRAAFVEEGGKILRGTYSLKVLVSYPSADPDTMRQALESGISGVTRVDARIVGNVHGLLGTDNYGRDIWEGMLYGFPIEIAVGLVTAIVVTAVGIVLGGLAGLYGGMVDEVVKRLIDLAVNIPILPLLVLVILSASASGVSPWGRMGLLILGLVSVMWAPVAYVARGVAIQIRGEPYVEAAIGAGMSMRQIFFYHVLPQLIPYSIASLVYAVPTTILTEAGLSLLQVRHGLVTWGTILADALAYVRSGGSYAAWWWILPPGIAIGVLSVIFVILGYGLEEYIEPRLRRR